MRLVEFERTCDCGCLVAVNPESCSVSTEAVKGKVVVWVTDRGIPYSVTGTYPEAVAKINAALNDDGCGFEVVQEPRRFRRGDRVRCGDDTATVQRYEDCRVVVLSDDGDQCWVPEGALERIDK